jgi:hypothetical protein
MEAIGLKMNVGDEADFHSALITMSGISIDSPSAGKWHEGEIVVEGMERTFGDVDYVCTHTHITLKDWTPDMTVELWTEETAGMEVTVEKKAGEKATEANKAEITAEAVMVPMTNPVTRNGSSQFGG